MISISIDAFIANNAAESKIYLTQEKKREKERERERERERELFALV
jgi:hypothetical protein